MRWAPLLVVMIIGPLCGCVNGGEGFGSKRQPLEEKLHLQRMAVLTRPPIIATFGPEDLEIARSVAANTDPAEVSRRESARWVGIDSIPLLTSTGAGRHFVAATAPRALARGMPQESCPAAAMASAAPPTPRAEIAVKALQECLAQLKPEHGDCGCRVVALDNLVMVAHEDTGYATGTTARMRAASLGIDLVLVAEETYDDEILLRDLRGPVALLRSGEGDAVTLEFTAGGRRFEGRRIRVGFRRGRIAERIYATDPEGNRLSLLIGFEPDELAARAGAWLAWPGEG